MGQIREGAVLRVFGFLFFFASAAYANNDQIKQSLLTRGVEVTVASLVQHAGQGDWTTVQALLRAGVSVNGVEPVRKQTALHAAASQGHERIVKELIQLQALPDLQDDCGNTALVNAAYSGRLAVVSVLLQTGQVNVDHQAQCGMTPLIAAIYGGDMASIRALLAAKANPLLASSQGYTPIQAAQFKKRPDMLALLDSAAR